MKVLLLLAFVGAALAVCPSTAASDMSTPTQVYAGYRYNYEMAKHDAHGSIYVVLGPEHESKYLYFKAISQSTTSDGGSLHTKYSIDSAAASTDPDWNPNAGTLVSDDEMRVHLNDTIAVGEQHWFTFFPDCSTCKSTIEFAVEIAILDSVNPDRYSVHDLKPQLRTLVFKTAKDEWVYFKYTNGASETDISISMVFDDDVADHDSQVALYWEQGTWPTANSTKYPAVGDITGDYVTQVPFKATAAGDYYLGANVLKQTISANDVDWTIKAGFNEAPCAGAAGLTVSLLSFIAIPLALFFKY